VYLKADQKLATHSAKVKTDMPEKKRKIARVRGVIPVVGKVEELWRKGLVEKMSFEPGVEEVKVKVNVDLYSVLS